MTCEICGDGPCQFPTFCSVTNATFKSPDPSQAQKPNLRLLDTSDWLAEPPPPQEWTVPDRIPRREVCLFSGEGGAGKSTIGLHLCAAHALGREWLGSLPEPGPSLFVDGEDDEKVIRRRFWHLGKHFGVEGGGIPELHLVSLHGQGCALATVARNGTLSPTRLFGELLAAARLFTPQTIVLASVANYFAGNENDRAQVTQFIQLMNHLAIEANGSVILISHPSVTGIKDNTGISGSTQWHNAVRSRLFLCTARTNGGEEPDPELKSLEFRKNQYGPIAASITVRWRDGLFLPDAAGGSLDRMARAAKVDGDVVAMIDRLERNEHFVSANPSARNYAANVLAGEREAVEHKLTKPELKAALARLVERGAIHIITYGKAAKPNQRLSAYNDGST